MPGNFEHGLFGCFDNCSLCILTYFCPCYTHGKTAEALGESCCLCGFMLFVPVAGLVSRISIRGKVREHRNIDGSCLGDLCTIIFCPFCALVQEAQEVQGPGGQYMTRE